MSTRTLLALGALIALAPACDTKAQPAAASNGVVADPSRLSAELESCGATAHCADDLRCFDQVCARVERSLLGDYYAGLGANRNDGGDLPGALEAYGEALKRYGLEKLTVPVALDCSYGAALSNDPAQQELAARVLHRCVNGAPVGSALHLTVLRAIARLDPSGLDPEHLVRDTPADVYLSRAPAKPTTLTTEVTASPEPKKGWAELSAAIKATRLTACFDLAHAASKAKELSVGVPIKAVYKTDPDYPDDGGTWVTGVDAKAPPPADDAEKCVRDAVASAIKGQKGLGDWTATVTVTIK